MQSLPVAFALLFVTVVPVAYTMGAQRAALRYGRSVLPVMLAAFGFGLSALGAWRIRAVTPANTAYRPFESHPFWMISLYAAFLIIGLLPTTIRIARATSQSTQAISFGRSAKEIPWFLLGLLAASASLFVLDFAGVRFLPGLS